MPGIGIRRVAVAIALVCGCLGSLPAAAEANDDAGDVRHPRDSAVALQSGDTIVLTGMCTGAEAAYTLPATANLTITGAASGTNGFDGTGVSGPALSGGPNGLTLSNLTFENYGTNAVRLAPNNPTNPYTFTNDTFSHNTSTGSGGGLSLLLQGTCSFAATAVTVTGSTFDHNSAGGSIGLGGGGGAYLESACGTAVAMQLDDNHFTNNTVVASGLDNGDGGGLFVATGIRGVPTPALTLTQNGNLFSGNAVSGTGGSYAGGGEYTNGANMTSRGDGFVSNTLPGPTTLAGSSEGGGLATFGGGLCITPKASRRPRLIWSPRATRSPRRARREPGTWSKAPACTSAAGRTVAPTT